MIHLYLKLKNISNSPFINKTKEAENTIKEYLYVYMCQEEKEVVSQAYIEKIKKNYMKKEISKNFPCIIYRS